MPGISEKRLLALGDAQPQGPLAQADAILAALDPEGGADGWLREPLGQVNRTILRARAEAIGELFDCVASCPRCDEQLSIEVRIAELIAHEPAGSTTVEWSSGAIRVEARLPNHGDLAAAAATGDASLARAVLVDRCVIDAEIDGVPEPPRELPEEAIGRVGELLDQLDPLTDLVFAATCSECGSDFDATLDAGSYVFGELTARARRLLYDIDALAQRYGWSEDEILALPAARRARYLELVG